MLSIPSASRTEIEAYSTSFPRGCGDFSEHRGAGEWITSPCLPGGFSWHRSPALLPICFAIYDLLAQALPATGLITWWDFNSSDSFFYATAKESKYRFGDAPPRASPPNCSLPQPPLALAPHPNLPRLTVHAASTLPRVAASAPRLTVRVRPRSTSPPSPASTSAGTSHAAAAPSLLPAAPHGIAVASVRCTKRSPPPTKSFLDDGPSSSARAHTASLRPLAKS